MKANLHTALSMATFAALSTLAVATPVAAQSVETREERREARRDGGPVSRSDGASTRRGEFTRRIEADVDADGERAYRSRTVTGPEGQSVGVLGEVARTADGATTSQTFTDRDGQTAGRSLSRSAEDGTYTRERNAYTRSGGTASASDTIERTDDGASRSTAFETSTGRGGSLDSDLTRTDDGASFSRTATDSEGNTVASRESTVTNDEDGLGRTTTISRPEGQD